MVEKLKAKANGKKGFTLAELLVVVGIIAVLVAIAIPVFTSSLNSAKVAVDEANWRAAYAGAKIAQISDLNEIVQDAKADLPEDGEYFLSDGTWGNKGASAVTAKATTTAEKNNVPAHSEGAYLKYTTAGGLAWENPTA